VTITYKPPKRLRKPFVRGQMVEVCDRDLNPERTQRKIVRVGKLITVTDCGRRWRTSDGWWIGENGTWPFPSIRHPLKH
jgi:hypothetical protein